MPAQSARVPWSVLALTLVPMLAAQQEPASKASLRERIERAAQQSEADELHRLAAEGVPLEELLDCVVGMELGMWSRGRALDILLRVREQPERLQALWRSQPERRVARRAAFARMPTFLVDRLARGDAAEQAAALASAPEIEYVHEIDVIWRGSPAEYPHLQRDGDADLRAAAERLRRAMVAGIDPATSPFRSLVLLDGSEAVRNAQVAAVQVLGAWRHPYELLPLLTHAEPAVRRRGVSLLRHALRLHVPRWIRLDLDGDPANVGRGVPGELPLVSGAALRDGILARLQDGVLPNVHELAMAKDLSDPVRQRLFDALCAKAIGNAKGPLPPLHSTPQPLIPGYEEFAGAAILGKPHAVAVLMHAVNDPKSRVAVAALLGLHVAGGFVKLDAGLGRLLVPLLDADDAQVRFAAARVADVLCASEPGPELRTAVGDRAVAALGRGTQLQFTIDWRGCATGPIPLGPPATADAQLVLTAAKLGEARLSDGLVKKLLEPAADPLQYTFVSTCLAHLAPQLDAAVAAKVHAHVLPSLKTPPLGQGWHGSSELLVSLMASVPEKLVAETLRNLPAQADGWWQMVAHLSPRIPPARMRMLAEAAPLRWTALGVLVHAPERVAADWQAGGARREAVRQLVNGPGESRQLLEVMPAEAAVAMACQGLVRYRMPLPWIARLLSSGAEAPGWTDIALELIYQAFPPGPDDLAAAKVLAGSKHGQIAIAGARHMALLGDGAGAAHALHRWLGGDDPKVQRAALRMALETGVRSPELDAAAKVVVAGGLDWEADVVAAAAIAWLGAAPRGFPRHALPSAIVLAKVEVPLATLREVLGPAPLPETGLRYLAQRAGATRANALRLLGEVPLWSAETTRAVAQATEAEEPAVRAAAFAALRTRDAVLEPEALLVHGAQFDPEPAVRAEVR